MAPTLTQDTSWKFTTKTIITSLILICSFLFSMGAYFNKQGDLNTNQDSAIVARVKIEEFRAFMSRYEKDRAIDSIRTSYILQELTEIKLILKQNNGSNK